MKKPQIEAAVPEPAPPPMPIETWSINRPVPYKRNARKWSGEAIQKVAASIKQFGWRQPIVADAQNVVVIGHLRLAAARYLGLDYVPVHVAGDLTPSQIKALRLADNRTHEESIWDAKLLGVELIELKAERFDLDVTGFDTAEIVENVFGAGKPKRKPSFEAPGGEVPEFMPASPDEQGQLDQPKHTCPKCGHEYFDRVA